MRIVIVVDLRLLLRRVKCDHNRAIEKLIRQHAKKLISIYGLA